MKKKLNKIPFIILLIVHTALLLFAFYKNKNRKKLFVLLMSNIGMAYLFEYIVLNVFNAYTYKPKMLKKPFLDDIFGAILSQAIFVPFTAVFITAQKIGLVGKFAAGCYFSLIEILFVRLKIYKQHWWKTAYTLILIPFYFKLSDLWKSVLDKEYPLIRVVSLFLMIMVSEANLLFILAINRKFRFGIGRFHSWKEHFIIVPLYAISSAIMATLMLMRENNWNAKWKVFISYVVINKIFTSTKLLRNKLGWFSLVVIRFFIVIIYGKYRDAVFGKGDNMN